MDCCQRLLPLIIHSILLDDSDGSFKDLLSSHIQDFFSFCCRSAQASSRSATPLTSDSGQFESVTNIIDPVPYILTVDDRSYLVFVCFEMRVYVILCRVRHCEPGRA